MAKTITLQTEALGRLTRTELRRRIKAAGSQAALARELGVAPTTVRSWAWRLRVLADNAKV